MRTFFVFIALTLAMTVQPTFAQTTGAAPADEYFGRLKMSPLGMRNQLQHMVRDVLADPRAGAHAMGMAAQVEDSIEDLVHKYPRESWIEGLVIGLQRYYAHIPTVEARLHLAHMTAFVHRSLPNTRLDTEAQSCATRILLADKNAVPALCENTDEVRVGRAFEEASATRP